MLFEVETVKCGNVGMKAQVSENQIFFLNFFDIIGDLLHYFDGHRLTWSYNRKSNLLENWTHEILKNGARSHTVCYPIHCISKRASYVTSQWLYVSKIDSPSFPLEMYRLEYTRLDHIIGDKFVHFRTTTERIPMITAIEFVAFYLQPSGFGREKLTGLFGGRYRHTLNRLVSNSPTWRAYSLYSISGKTQFDWIEKKSQAKAKTELLYNGNSS